MLQNTFKAQNNEPSTPRGTKNYRLHSKSENNGPYWGPPKSF